MQYTQRILQRSVTLIRRLLCTLPYESMSGLADGFMGCSHEAGLIHRMFIRFYRPVQPCARSLGRVVHCGRRGPARQPPELGPFCAAFKSMYRSRLWLSKKMASMGSFLDPRAAFPPAPSLAEGPIRFGGSRAHARSWRFPRLNRHRHGHGQTRPPVGPRSLRIHWPLATLNPPLFNRQPPDQRSQVLRRPSPAGPRLSFCPLLSSSSFSFSSLRSRAFLMTAPSVSYNWIELASRIPCPVEIGNTLGRRLHEHNRGCSSRESSGADCLGVRDLRDHALFERGADGRSVCGQGAAGIATTGRERGGGRRRQWEQRRLAGDRSRTWCPGHR